MRVEDAYDDGSAGLTHESGEMFAIVPCPKNGLAVDVARSERIVGYPSITGPNRFAVSA